jgi:GT2 family glycosyltransferase
MKICKVTFATCMDRLGNLISYDDLKKEGQNEGIYIFAADNGVTSADSEKELAAAFEENPTAVMVYADEGYPDMEGWYKPDFSPDTLNSFFYIGNIFALKSETLQKVYTSDISLYEAVIAASKLESVDIRRDIVHLPKVLYTNSSCDEKKSLPGIDIKFNWEVSLKPENELVSIIIPSKDNSTVLKKCLDTLFQYTRYENYEVIVVDNGSSESERLCISGMSQRDFTYVYDRFDFNFSKMCNIGAKKAKGTHLLFLNDDIEIIDENWLGNMLSSSMQTQTGAVGAKLYYPKNKNSDSYLIQHVGITNMGIGPAHKLCGMEDKGNLYHGHNIANYNMLAVTGACMMIKRELFERMGGFDEELAVAYNDVELCFRLYKAGYYNVVRNDAVLIHHESLSRGEDTSPEKKRRLIHEKHKLYEKHPEFRAKDPFYSPNLVQWKWDCKYNDGYLYDYDKKTEPVKLDEAGIKALPVEHTDKYVKKLLGENRPMLNIDGIDYIDSIENMYDRDLVLVRGWSVLRERNNDSSACEKWLLLKSVENEEVIYRLKIYPKQREDVAGLFETESQKSSRTKNAANSGINVIFETEDIPRGSYYIGVLIKNNRRYYKKWSTEIVDTRGKMDGQ